MKTIGGAARRRIRQCLITLLCTASLVAPSTVVRAQQGREDRVDALIEGTVAVPAVEALGAAWIARIDAVGLVRVTGSELAGRGAPTTFARLCLRWRGHVLSMQSVDADSDGTIDDTDEVRFVAPGAGDRYNADDAYWFSDDPTCHRAMAVRAANLVGGSARVTVRQRGMLRPPSRYSEQHDGADGDHWFADYLASDFTEADTWPFEASTPGDLPSAIGSATYTVTGVARTKGAHAAQLTGNGANASLSWSGDGVFTVAVQVDAGTIPTGFVLRAGAIDAVLPDALYWDRPVLLAPDAAGAVFVADGSADHVVTGASEERVYEIGSPLTPTVIALASGRFSAARHGRYLIPGTATLKTATLESYSLQAGEDLRTARNAAAVYIAPRAWISTLEPLLTRRRTTIGSATAVPVEAIYAQFGHGQVDPWAIREFLRYAYTTWGVRPKGVALIGDATFDVRNYGGWGFPMILPPYLADIDPYNGAAGQHGEAACEACFAQLDGIDPLSDGLPELTYGRIPAQTTAQLSAYVAKVIGYETAVGGDFAGSWRGDIAYLVDDTVHPDGTRDSSGDFWSTAEDSIAEQNFYTGIRRLYYDPTGALGPVSYTAGEPDLASNPPHDRARVLFETGAAFVTYIGHASQNRIGDLGNTELDVGNSFLNQVEVDSLTNFARLPILLEMTCLTGAYTYSYVDDAQRVSTAFDERMVLASGGAIAAWGSTGLGVAYGHDIMLSGFFTALWGGGGRSLTLGELAQAGYVHLDAAPEATFGDDLIRTFLITGDPFLQPRVYAPRVLLSNEVRRVNIPLAVR
jgi:hypothetical protein